MHYPTTTFLANMDLRSVVGIFSAHTHDTKVDMPDVIQTSHTVTRSPMFNIPPITMNSHSDNIMNYLRTNIPNTLKSNSWKILLNDISLVRVKCKIIGPTLSSTFETVSPMSD